MTLIPRGPSRDTSFRVVLRGAVWEVTKNNRFYGDYLNREQAVRGACYGARAVEASGGEARVLAPPSEQVIDHRDPAIAS